jgi:hypothetical protein
MVARAEGAPASLVDSSGNFYKQLQVMYSFTMFDWALAACGAAQSMYSATACSVPAAWC